MTGEEMVEELIAIIPELEKDGFTDDEIWEYCINYITFNKQR